MTRMPKDEFKASEVARVFLSLAQAHQRDRTANRRNLAMVIHSGAGEHVTVSSLSKRFIPAEAVAPLLTSERAATRLWSTASAVGAQAFIQGRGGGWTKYTNEYTAPGRGGNVKPTFRTTKIYCDGDLKRRRARRDAERKGRREAAAAAKADQLSPLITSTGSVMVRSRRGQVCDAAALVELDRVQGMRRGGGAHAAAAMLRRLCLAGVPPRRGGHAPSSCAPCSP